MRSLIVLEEIFIILGMLTQINSVEFESLDEAKDLFYFSMSIQSVRCNSYYYPNSCGSQKIKWELTFYHPNHVAEIYTVFDKNILTYGVNKENHPYLRNLLLPRFGGLVITFHAKGSTIQGEFVLLRLEFGKYEDFNEIIRVQNPLHDVADHVFDLRLKLQKSDKYRTSFFFIFMFRDVAGKKKSEIYENILKYDIESLLSAIYYPYNQENYDNYMCFPPDFVFQPNDKWQSIFANKGLKDKNSRNLDLNSAFKTDDKYFYFRYEDGVSKGILKIINYKEQQYKIIQIDKNTNCPKEQCNSHGTCEFVDNLQQNNFKFKCNCEDGYFGFKCEFHEIQCVNCHNTQYLSTGTLSCYQGWSGSDCQTPIIINNMCGSNGTPDIDNNNRVCSCNSGYEGDYCEKINTPPPGTSNPVKEPTIDEDHSSQLPVLSDQTSYLVPALTNSEPNPTTASATNPLLDTSVNNAKSAIDENSSLQKISAIGHVSISPGMDTISNNHGAISNDKAASSNVEGTVSKGIEPIISDGNAQVNINDPSDHGISNQNPLDDNAIKKDLGKEPINSSTEKETESPLNDDSLKNQSVSNERAKIVAIICAVISIFIIVAIISILIFHYKKDIFKSYTISPQNL